MKRTKFLLALALLLTLAVVFLQTLDEYRGEVFSVPINVPEGASGFVYSHWELMSHTGAMTLSAYPNVGDTRVALLPLDDTKPPEPVYITPGLEVDLQAEKGKWYKVGVDVGENHEAAQLFIDVRVYAARVP